MQTNTTQMQNPNTMQKAPVKPATTTQQVQPAQPKKSKKWLWIIIAAVILIVLGIAAFLLLFK